MQHNINAEHGDQDGDTIVSSRPLAVAALIKQVPVAESLSLGEDGRLSRDASPLEMNPYCRRAVSKGVELAQATGGRCVVFTLGPPSADDAVREALAWGADEGVHLCHPAFAGSDTLATARALAAAVGAYGPFDLVLVGRNTVDGDTGQVGPELAEMLGLPFAAGVRHLAIDESDLRLELEQDDGWATVALGFPALLSVAERLCQPAKVPPEGRAQVPAERIRCVGPDELGPGPWGDAGSPTKVGRVRTLHHDRAQRVLSGAVEAQVKEAVMSLEDRGALTPGASVPAGEPSGLVGEGAESSTPRGTPARPCCVVVEPGRPQVARELLGAARRVGGSRCPVVVFGPLSELVDTEASGNGLAAAGADLVIGLEGVIAPEDVSRGLVSWAAEHHPWLVLAPSTSFGREVAGRTAAALEAGLVGDAIGVEVAQGVLVAPKPAFSGALVADITCTSEIQLVTVRPGVLPLPPPQTGRRAAFQTQVVQPAGRVQVLAERRDDDVEVLARAEVVIGLGTGVAPEEYPLVKPLTQLLGAELAATRKVTDKGWMPRARQVGITGRSVSPRLYVALGLSGKFNHVVGFRSAGTVLAVNQDPEAPVFSHADLGIVGDWHQVVPLLAAALADTGAVATGA